MIKMTYSKKSFGKYGLSRTSDTNVSDVEDIETRPISIATNVELHNSSAEVFGLKTNTLESIFLPNSGIKVVLVTPPPLEIDKLILEVNVLSERIGYISNGLATANTDVLLHKLIFGFIKNSVHKSSGNLDEILVPDLMYLISHFIDNLNIKTVIDWDCKCGVHNSKKYTLRELTHIKKSHPATEQGYNLFHMSSSAITDDLVKSYRSQVNKEKIIKIDNITVTLAVPNLVEYFTNGEMWIDFILDNLEEFDVDDTVDNKRALLNKLVRASIGGVYIHYIKKLTDGNGNYITGRNEILNYIISRSNDNSFTSELIVGTIDYMEETSLVKLGHKAKCEECGHAEEKIRKIDIIQLGLDVLSAFAMKNAERLTISVFKQN